MSTDSLSEHPRVREFLEAVAPNLSAYRRADFSYVALIHNGEPVILQARMLLTIDPPARTRAALRTLSLSAGYVSLDIDSASVEACIRCAVANDWLPVFGDQPLKLLPSAPPQYSQGYSAHFDHQVPPQSPVTRDRLVVSGINRSQLLGMRWREIARELQELGYDSLEEVLKAYGLPREDATALEIAANPVAMIYSTSQLQGRHARLHYALARGLDPGRFRVTIRNADAGAVSAPIALAGDQVQWTEQADTRDGQWELELSQNAIIDCRAVYAGNVQAALRLADINALPNPLRNMIGLVDPGCARLEKLLTAPDKT